MKIESLFIVNEILELDQSSSNYIFKTQVYEGWHIWWRFASKEKLMDVKFEILK